MGRVKNISGEARIVPLLGDRLVLAGQTVDVSDDVVYEFTQQTTLWSPADVDTEAIHDEEERAYEARVSQLEDPRPPAGNASRDEWVAYVTAVGLASAGELEGMGRDAIRDTYGPTAASDTSDPTPPPVSDQSALQPTTTTDETGSL